VGQIVANDIDPLAMERIAANMAMNNISSDKILLSHVTSHPNVPA
jgi:ribosomal protein L11 methylase PrmA